MFSLLSMKQYHAKYGINTKCVEKQTPNVRYDVHLVWFPNFYIWDIHMDRLPSGKLT